MTLGRKVLTSLAVMAVVLLGAPMVYRYYLLNVAPVTRPQAPSPAVPAPTPTATPVVLASVPAPAPGTWEVAIAQVEEARGSAGRVEVPDDLQHYEDRRRFLAVQMADSQDGDYRPAARRGRPGGHDPARRAGRSCARSATTTSSTTSAPTPAMTRWCTTTSSPARTCRSSRRRGLRGRGRAAEPRPAGQAAARPEARGAGRLLRRPGARGDPLRRVPGGHRPGRDFDGVVVRPGRSRRPARGSRSGC